MSVFEYAHVLHDIVRKPSFVNYQQDLSAYIPPSVLLPVTIVESDGSCSMRFNHNLTFPYKYLNITFANESFFVPESSFIPAFGALAWNVNMGPNFREASTGEVYEAQQALKSNVKNAGRAALGDLPLESISINAGAAPSVDNFASVSLSGVKSSVVPNTSETFVAEESGMTICRNSATKVEFSLTNSASDQPLASLAQSKEIQATNSTIAPGPGQVGGYPNNNNDPFSNPPSVGTTLNQLIESASNLMEVSEPDDDFVAA